MTKNAVIIPERAETEAASELSWPDFDWNRFLYQAFFWRMSENRFTTKTAWCSNAVKVGGQCSTDVQFLMLRCRPYYLPREFSSVFTVAVYIPLDANLKNALQELLDVISRNMTKQLDGIFIVAGGFNQTDLRTVLPKFQQHVQIPTGGRNWPRVYKYSWQLQSPPTSSLWPIRSSFSASAAYSLSALSKKQKPKMMPFSQATRKHTILPEQDWKLASRRQRGDIGRDQKGTSRTTPLKIRGRWCKMSQASGAGAPPSCMKRRCRMDISCSCLAPSPSEDQPLSVTPDGLGEREYN